MIIAHRASTLKVAHRVFNVANGSITELSTNEVRTLVADGCI